MTDRPTKELTLIDCKHKLILYSNLRNGDFRQIQAEFLTDSRIDATKGVAELANIPATTALKIQDLTLRLLIKKVLDENGEEVSNIDDFIYNLSVEDGKQLYEFADNISKDSTLGAEIKKK